MSVSPDIERIAAWHGGLISEEELASALLCEIGTVRALLGTPGFRDERRPGRSNLSYSLSPRLRVGLAIAHALNRDAGLSLPIAADVVSGCCRICDSVLATLDFFPPAEGESERDRIDRRPCDERDPLMFFVPHANDALPVAAIDEYVDVIDARRIVWRRPRRDGYELACELHRLSEAAARHHTPCLQEEFLAAVGRLREPADQIADWMGTVGEGRFRPRPDRFADETPFLRQGIDFAGNPGRFADTYRTRISINVSLAARSMKRRFLRLQVAGTPWNPGLHEVAEKHALENRSYGT